MRTIRIAETSKGIHHCLLFGYYLAPDNSTVLPLTRLPDNSTVLPLARAGVYPIGLTSAGVPADPADKFTSVLILTGTRWLAFF